MRRQLLLGVTIAFAAGCSDPVGPGGTTEGVAMNGAVALRYIVDLPEGEGPFPTVVYGPGSGNVSAESSSVLTHARELVRLGFAVVRYDKRGVGGSDGELLNLSTANSGVVVPLLAGDMSAVLRAATALPEVDASRLGLFGASQANWYLPLVARDNPSVDWVVILTGGLLPVGPKNEWERLVFVEGRDPFAASTFEEWSLYSGPTGFDQRPVIQGLNRPLLYLLGDRDRGVPLAPNLEEANALQAVGVDLTIESFVDGVHLLEGINFWGVVSGWLEELD